MGSLVSIYQPISQKQKKLFPLLIAMGSRLYSARELVWRLFLRDFQVRYKQSLLGWGWAFLIPLIAVGTFLILSQSAIVYIIDLPAPYTIYGLLGISLWQIFAGGLTNATGSLVSARDFIIKINFPRESLVIASLGVTLVDFLIRMALMLGLYLFYGLTPSIWVLLFPILILPLILITLGIGLVTSLLNAVIRDIQNLLNIALGFFLFLMPVMYTLPKTSLLSQLNQFNPVYFLIAVPREIIISGNFSHLEQFLISSIIALVIFIFGWIIFIKAQAKIGEAA